MASSPRSPLSSPRLEVGRTPLATPTGLVSVRMSRQMSDAIRRQKTGTDNMGYWTLPGSAATGAPSVMSRPFSRARAHTQLPNLDVLANAANSAKFGRPRWRSQSVPRLPRPVTTHDVIRPNNALTVTSQVSQEAAGRSSSLNRKPDAGGGSLTCMQLTDAILNGSGGEEVSSLYAVCSQRMRYVDYLEEELAAREEEDARRRREAMDLHQQQQQQQQASRGGSSRADLLKSAASRQPDGTVSDLLRSQSSLSHVSGVHPPPPPPPPSTSCSPTPGSSRSRGGSQGTVQPNASGKSPAVPSIPRLKLNHVEHRMEAGGLEVVSTTLPSPHTLSRDKGQGDFLRSAVLQRYGTADVIRIPSGGELVVRGTLVPLEEQERGATPAVPRGSHVTASGTVRRYVTPSKVCAVTPRPSAPKRRGVRFSKSDLVYEYLPLEALPD